MVDLAQMVKNLPAVRETHVQSLVRKILWSRKWQPTLVLLLGKFHEWRSLVGYSHGVAESDATELLHFPCRFDPSITLYTLICDTEAVTLQIIILFPS